MIKGVHKTNATKHKWLVNRGSSGRKWSKLSNFCFSRWLAALEPPQNEGKKGGGQRVGGFHFFFVFNRKRKRKWKKYFVHFVGNLSRIPKLFFFHSSIKTEKVLFFYIYIYIFVYIYKLSPKWKKYSRTTFSILHIV